LNAAAHDVFNKINKKDFQSIWIAQIVNYYACRLEMAVLL